MLYAMSWFGHECGAQRIMWMTGRRVDNRLPAPAIALDFRGRFLPFWATEYLQPKSGAKADAGTFSRKRLKAVASHGHCDRAPQNNIDLLERALRSDGANLEFPVAGLVAVQTKEPLMSGAECHPWLAEIAIDGLYHGKPGRFSAWRGVIADIVGAPIEYTSTRHVFAIPNALPNPPQTLEFIEAKVTDPTWLVDGRAGHRRGIWDATPEEPLWIVLLATVPGATFFAHHAGAIAQRLQEIDELVHYVGKGGVTGLHENACRCFAEQAKTGQDMTMSGGYEPTGWWSPDLDL